MITTENEVLVTAKIVQLLVFTFALMRTHKDLCLRYKGNFQYKSKWFFCFQMHTYVTETKINLLVLFL